MAQEIDYASIRDGVIKAWHLHAQAGLPRSAITQKALASFPQDIHEVILRCDGRP